MQDELGIYYHPTPGNADERVYVRHGLAGEVEFRLWRKGNAEIWERHGWLTLDTIKAAATMYRAERNANADMLKLYDLSVARSLLAEAGK